MQDVLEYTYLFALIGPMVDFPVLHYGMYEGAWVPRVREDFRVPHTPHYQIYSVLSELR